MSSLDSTSDRSFEPEPVSETLIDDVQAHLDLLSCNNELVDANAFDAVPVFTNNVRERILKSPQSQSLPQLSQYSLLGGNVSDDVSFPSAAIGADRRVFYNIAAPTSIFICGSQGSGKSHTLSTLLESCLIPCQANQLPRPLTGLVFHYDAFTSDTGGNACEAAYISSNDTVKVKVLCAPTNIGHIKRIYERLPNILVQELRIDQSDLNTKRMLDLMAVSSIQGTGMPLYLHIVSRILRDLRVLQQKNDTPFDYSAFKPAIQRAGLTEAQSVPLQQRLETLESFMALRQTTNRLGAEVWNDRSRPDSGNSWKPVPGQLTIIDLSCPCVTADMACTLFNICLGLFLEQNAEVGRIIALDEARKYMGESIESQTLTDSLLSSIRLQRHLGARVIISTQEPTISPKLLDLCSVTIVHRFTSPDWLTVLERHIAGISILPQQTEATKEKSAGSDATTENHTLAPHLYVGSRDVLFPQILSLRTGEAFVFAPSAFIGVGVLHPHEEEGFMKEATFYRLTHGALKIRIRRRLTTDGGRSLMAN